MHEIAFFSQRARVELEEILKIKECQIQESQPSWLSKWIDRILNRLSGGEEWLIALFKLLFYFVIVMLITFVCIFVARRFHELPSRTSGKSDSPAIESHILDPVLHFFGGAASDIAADINFTA